MAVYDKAHELAKAIKESQEYITYKQSKEKAYQDSNLAEQIKEFDHLKYEVQLSSIQGEKQDEEKMKKLQDLYVKLMEQKDAKEYFDCEVRFNVMLADMNKIIGEAVQDVLK